MPLTRDFKETINARIEKDPAFRDELLREGIECLLSGDLDVGKAVLRDYINATMKQGKSLALGQITEDGSFREPSLNAPSSGEEN